jgi:3'-phosphoadenosine 5'-phosphosulfate sulfotransferase (PAPS reductase)/FAD synthetase|tara:strand:- start:78 stop:248 length:171 start_codon:yes stop_codon:yes gene_type:complete
MEKKVHPITGFEILRERDNRECCDIIVKPSMSRAIREMVSSGGRLPREWYYGLRRL